MARKTGAMILLGGAMLLTGGPEQIGSIWFVPWVAIIAAGLCLAFAQWTTEPLRFPGTFSVNLWFGHWIVAPIMVVLLLVALFDLWHRLRNGLPLEDQEQVPEAAGQH